MINNDIYYQNNKKLDHFFKPIKRSKQAIYLNKMQRYDPVNGIIKQ